MKSFHGHYGGFRRHSQGSRGEKWSGKGEEDYDFDREGGYEAVEARRRADTPFSRKFLIKNF